MSSAVKARPNISRLLEVRSVFKRYALLSLLDDVELPRRIRFAATLMLGKGGKADEPRGPRLRKALEESKA